MQSISLQNLLSQRELLFYRPLSCEKRCQDIRAKLDCDAMRGAQVLKPRINSSWEIGADISLYNGVSFCFFT